MNRSAGVPRFCLALEEEGRMKVVTGGRLARHLAGVVLPLAASLLLAPVEVRASCGDYVVMGSKAGSAIHSVPLPHWPVTPQTIPSVPKEDPKPCAGPMCSRVPLSFPSIPATVATERGLETALVPSPPPPPDFQSITRQIDDAPGRSSRRLVDVYHPPRSCGLHIS